MLKIIKLIIISVLVVIMQFGVLPSISDRLSPVLILPIIWLSLVILFSPREYMFSTAILTGLLVDVYTPYPMGTFIIIFILATVISYFFLDNFFHYKNLFSLLIVNLFFTLIWYIGIGFFYFINITQHNSINLFPLFINFILSLTAHTLFLLIFYRTIPYIRNSFKATFIK